MIQNDVVNQLQLLIKTVSPPLLEVAKAPLETPQLVPGQRLQATVLASLGNGRFQAQIGEQVLDMNLPKNTQPGEKLDLTFVTSQPRLTFVMSRDISRDILLPQGAKKSDVSISDTARFLGALLDKAASRSSSEAVPLTKTAPVLSAAPGNTPALAQALQKTVSQSGLFYESHQAQWVTGQRPLADLLQEPQAQLSRPGLLQGQSGPERASPAPTQAGQSAAETQASAKPSPQSAPVHSQIARPLAELLPGQSAAETQVSAKPLPQSDPVHPQTAPLVQQQMELLDSRQVVWQGQIWPGQLMDWKIEERAAREQGPAESAEWQTSLHLDLPRLGDVTATLQLSAMGIRLAFKVTEAATADTMRIHQSELQQSMSDAGLSLASLSVEAVDEQA